MNENQNNPKQLGERERRIHALAQQRRITRAAAAAIVTREERQETRDEREETRDEGG